MNLTKKFILIFIIGIVVPFIFIVYLNYFNLVSVFKNNTFNYLEVNLEKVNENLENYFEKQKKIYVFFDNEKIISDISAIKQNPAAKELFSKSISDSLIKTKFFLNESVFPDLIGVEATNSDGIVIASTNEFELGKNESQSDVFKNILSASKFAIYIGDINRMSKFGFTGYFLVAAYPFFNNGQFLGSIIFYYNASHLENILKPILVSGLENINNYIVNSGGYFITLASELFPVDILLKKNETLPVKLCADKNEVRDIYKNYLRREVMGLSKCLNNGWILVSEIETGAISKIIFDFRNKLFIAGILIILLFLLPIFMIISRKIDEILEIIAAVSKITAGSLRFSINARSKDEIGNLALMINQMAGNLRENYDNLIYEKQKTESLLLIEEDRHQILSDLNQEIIKILENFDIEARLVQITNSLKNIFKVDAASIYMVDGDVFKIKSSIGISENYVKNQILKPKQYLIDILTKERLLELIDIEEKAVGDLDLIKKENLKSALAAPIISGDKFYGFMCLYSKGTVRKFKDFEKDLFKIFSVQMSLGIRNSELFIKVFNEKNKLNIILESMGEGIYVIDFDGRFILFNKKAEEILGWNRDEVLFKNHTDFLKITDDRGKLMLKNNKGECLIDLIWKKGNFETFYNFNFQKKNGLKISVKLTIAPVKDQNGNPIFGVIIFLDISKEKEAEKIRVEFISIASHQLRTPLTAIKWYLELLGMPKYGELSEKQKNYLRQAYDSTNKMNTLVNDLLNVSNIESGELKVNIIKIDVVAVVKKMIEFYKPLTEGKKIAVDFSYSQDEILMEVDGDIFQQIVQNIFLNAIKYTPENGKISVFLELRPEEIFFKIQDTGYGIIDKEKPKVFTKFFRGKNIVKKVTEGTGLGLFIVKSFIDYFGGKVWFESEENKGTIFYFTIPLKRGKI